MSNPPAVQTYGSTPVIPPTRYLVWGGPHDYKECDTLVEALQWRQKLGGVVYEPIGFTTAERLIGEGVKEARGDVGETLAGNAVCCHCRRKISGADPAYRNGDATRPYHQGCLRQEVRVSTLTSLRKAANRKLTARVPKSCS